MSRGNPLQGFADVVEKGLATAWQGYVADQSGSVVSEAAGVDALRRPVSTQSQFSVYCAGKPVLGMLASVAVDSGRLRLDDRVRELLDWDDAALGDGSVAELLEHRSGVCRPNAVDAAFVRVGQLGRVAATAPLVDQPLRRNESMYSEAAAWAVLGAALERVLSTNLAAATDELVLGPLEIRDDFDLGSERDASDRHRLNVSLRDANRRPLLAEQTRPFSFVANPGYGLRGTARGLALLGDELVKALDGRGRILAPMTAAEAVGPRAIRQDRALKREAAFGLGWMTRLDLHGFGKVLSPRAFGHVGLGGMTAMFADPDSGFVGAYHLNGLTNAGTTLRGARPELVEQLCSAIG